MENTFEYELHQVLLHAFKQNIQLIKIYLKNSIHTLFTLLPAFTSG